MNAAVEGAGSIDPAPLVARVRYKPGWALKVAGPMRSKLCVFVTSIDSSRPTRMRTTQHQFDLPVVTDERDLYRWIFAQLLLAERHEAGEFFAVGDHRPFYPNHQDEGSPHEHVEHWE